MLVAPSPDGAGRREREFSTLSEAAVVVTCPAPRETRTSSRPARKLTVVEPEQETSSTTRLAPQWKVILHNDDVTTFEFVIDLLRTLFKKPAAEALRLTQEVHDSGSALITITTFEHAELYVDQVKSLARPRGFPLVASMEPAD